MDHGALQAVKKKVSEAVPAAEFGELDCGWTVNVGISGAEKRYVLSQVYRHAYSGHMLATDMGVDDIIAKLKADEAALAASPKPQGAAYPFWPNGFTDDMQAQLIEMATMAAIDAYWLRPGNPNEDVCAFSAEAAYDSITRVKVSVAFAESNSGRKWIWNVTWRGRTLLKRCRDRDMSIEGPAPGDYNKLPNPTRGPDPLKGGVNPTLSDSFTVLMCQPGTTEYEVHKSATLAAIAEYWSSPGPGLTEQQCAEAAWEAYLRVLGELRPDDYANPSVATLWDWEWRRATILRRCRRKAQSISGPQHSGPLLFLPWRRQNPIKQSKTDE